MRLKIVLTVVTIALTALVCLAHPAGAVNLTGSIAADDAFVLYYGNSDGTGLTQIASGGTGSQGGINWNVVNGNFVPSVTSLSVSVTIPGGSYLYVMVWNSPGASWDNPQAWLGQFNVSGKTIYSNLQTWQYMYSTSGNPSQSGMPSIASLAGQIAAAQWQTATPVVGTAASWYGNSTSNTLANGSAGNKWTDLNGGQPVAGISTNADWVWWDTFANSQSQDGYAIFMAPADLGTAVPAPAALLLLGPGLFGVAALKRKFNK